MYSTQPNAHYLHLHVQSPTYNLPIYLLNLFFLFYYLGLWYTVNISQGNQIRQLHWAQQRWKKLQIHCCCFSSLFFLMECSWNAAGTQLSAFISQVCTKITSTAWSYDNYLWIRALGLRHYTQLEISQEPEDNNKHKAEKLVFWTYSFQIFVCSVHSSMSISVTTSQ